MTTAAEPFFASKAAGTTATVRFGDAKSTPRYAVAYWSIRGLGAPLRMMMCAAKVDFDVIMYDLLEEGDSGWTSQYFAEKTELKGEKYKCALMNLPFVVDQEKERIICQTNACFAYLGRSVGMFGKDEMEQTACQELLCEIYDIRNIMTKFTYTSAGTKGDADAAVRQADGHFNKLELYLKLEAEKQGKSDDPVVHLVGGLFSAPDFHLFEMLDQYSKLDPDCLSKYPLLSGFKKRFEELEENQFYLNSWLHTGLPMNNCMAKFGSAPGPAVYKRGQKVDWYGKGKITMSP